MEISYKFSLSGFTRIDAGEEGAVFVSYKEKPDEREPEIRETPMYYGGADTVNFTISLPKPRRPELNACAIVTHSSKNCFAATAFDGKRIQEFKTSSLKALYELLIRFFY